MTFLKLILISTCVAIMTSGCQTIKSDAIHRPAQKTASSIAATSLQSAGVVSSAVVDENKKPGTSNWRIGHQGKGFIEGFANLNYALQGQSVNLYVSTDQSSFQVTAFRMGWYQGLGARQIWTSGDISGVKQPSCPLDHRTNMISCDNWSTSLSMAITDEFVPGDYLLKLTTSSNRQSYILLTIWNPSSTATYLVLNRSMVEQGWNTYGGYDYYQGQGKCILDSAQYPPCNRARVVSFDRPYADPGSSDFLDNEYPMVQFMEQNGLDATYCTDICLSEHPEFIKQHKALIDLDHDETWTNSERLGVLNAVDAGVNVAFFGAATLVRHARLESSPLGPDRQEIDYRNESEDPLNGHGDPWQVTGNTWSTSPTKWDANNFLGESYSGFIKPDQPSVPMVVFDANGWIFKNTGLKQGDSIPAAINSDIDHLDPNDVMPKNVQVFGHSPISLSNTFTNQGKWNGFTYSDMTYYTNASSYAGIFDSGDNIWVGAMRPCETAKNCPAPMLQLMTANVLSLFGQGPAGNLQPSQANWQAVQPFGS